MHCYAMSIKELWWDIVSESEKKGRFNAGLRIQSTNISLFSDDFFFFFAASIGEDQCIRIATFAILAVQMRIYISNISWFTQIFQYSQGYPNLRKKRS